MIRPVAVRNYLLATSMLALAAGCATPNDPAAPGPGSISASALNPGECNNKRCVVEISLASGTNCNNGRTAINPDELQLPDNTVFNKGRVLVWRFKDGFNAKFCPSKGDGVFLQPFRQGSFFERAGGTDQDEGGEEDQAVDRCFKRFRIFNWNGDMERFRYFVHFTGPTGETCKIDPWIKNGK